MTDTHRPAGRGRYIPTIFSIVDLIIVNIIFFIAYHVFALHRLPESMQRQMLVLINVCYFPMIALILGDRHQARAITMETVVKTTLTAVGLHALSFMALSTFLHLDITGKFYVFYYSVLLVSLTLFRLSANYALKAMRRRGFNFTRVVIIGTGPSARRLYTAMETDAGFGYRIVGVFDDDPDDRFHYDNVLPLSELGDFVAANRVRQVFFTSSGHSEALAKVLKIADDHVLDFYYVPQIPGTLTRKFELHNIGPIPVLAMDRNPLKNPLNRGAKRAFDLAVSSIFLLFYPLVYIPVAIAIKISSPGPVYFKQERTGYLGDTFMCYKFRTMKVNTDSDRCQATRDDPRKTRVGDFLRRTSIDELPQFINVFRGDMSVVGPRPHMLKHTEDYTRLVDRYMIRHAVKPGITGWAQVNGYRGITDQLWKMERRVEHDVWYIENWSMLLDLKIVVRTIINAIAGEKNAF